MENGITKKNVSLSCDKKVLIKLMRSLRSHHLSSLDELLKKNACRSSFIWVLTVTTFGLLFFLQFDRIPNDLRNQTSAETLYRQETLTSASLDTTDELATTGTVQFFLTASPFLARCSFVPKCQLICV